MRLRLMERVKKHIARNRHRPVWARRFLAMCYGASFRTISKIKEDGTTYYCGKCGGPISDKIPRHECLAHLVDFGNDAEEPDEDFER